MLKADIRSGYCSWFGGMQTHPGAAQAAVGRTRPETAQDAAQATVL